MSCLRLVLLVISLFLLVLLPTSALFPYTTLFRSPAGSRPRRRELSRFPPPRTLDRTDFHWGPLSSLHALLECSEVSGAGQPRTNPQTPEAGEESAGAADRRSEERRVGKECR